jgi:hypothetical protein
MKGASTSVGGSPDRAHLALDADGPETQACPKQKVKLFEEVRQRPEGRQVKLAAAEARKASQAESALALAVTRKARIEPSKVIVAKRPSSKRAAVAAATRSPRASVGLTSEKASAAARRSQLAGSRSKVIQAHIASQGRRQQAVRDKR